MFPERESAGSGVVGNARALGARDRGFESRLPDHLHDRDILMARPTVTEMRLVVTAADFDEAVAFYRDVLGLPELASHASADGRVVILEAGRATLEIADPAQAEFIDRVEVGRRVAGHIRVAFEVGDAALTAATLADAGATVLAEATRTPWRTDNARLEGPGGLQLTLFSEAPPSD